MARRSPLARCNLEPFHSKCPHDRGFRYSRASRPLSWCHRQRSFRTCNLGERAARKTRCRGQHRDGEAKSRGIQSRAGASEQRSWLASLPRRPRRSPASSGRDRLDQKLEGSFEGRSEPEHWIIRASSKTLQRGKHVRGATSLSCPLHGDLDASAGPRREARPPVVIKEKAAKSRRRRP
jgi:hypothetical protein